MCGRYALHSHPEVIALQFGLAEAPELRPRYNIAPTQEAPVIRLDAGRQPQVALLRWGLVPGWAKDRAIGAGLINARAETVAEKPAFRNAFRRRRCLVPTDGYYEWKATAGTKQPYFLHFADGRPFAMAGLWERWTGPDGETAETYAVLTTEAVGRVREIHQRMPVLVAPPDYARWLDDRGGGMVLPPWSGPELSLRRVSRWVNSPRHDDERCVQPDA